MADLFITSDSSTGDQIVILLSGYSDGVRKTVGPNGEHPKALCSRDAQLIVGDSITGLIYLMPSGFITTFVESSFDAPDNGDITSLISHPTASGDLICGNRKAFDNRVFLLSGESTIIKDSFQWDNGGAKLCFVEWDGTDLLFCRQNITSAPSGIIKYDQFSQVVKDVVHIDYAAQGDQQGGGGMLWYQDDLYIMNSNQSGRPFYMLSGFSSVVLDRIELGSVNPPNPPLRDLTDMVDEEVSVQVRGGTPPGAPGTGAPYGLGAVFVGTLVNGLTSPEIWRSPGPLDFRGSTSGCVTTAILIESCDWYNGPASQDWMSPASGEWITAAASADWFRERDC